MGKFRRRIVFVDKNMSTQDQGRSILKTFYEVLPALSVEKLFGLLDNFVPDMILLDIGMPEMSGYEALRRLKADERFADIPVIFLATEGDPCSEVEILDLGATDYITRPFPASKLLKRIGKELEFARQKNELIATQTKLQNHLDNLEVIVHEKAEAIMRLQNAVFETVVDMVEFRDAITGGHILRTQQYLQVLLEEMIKEGIYAEEIADWDMTEILSSAKLHDVGKIAVPDVILIKNGKLTREEFDSMKSHVTIGVDAIERILNKTEESTFLNHALRIAGTHHEKWDGSGYPIGLTGMNIPLEGQLMAIVDVYDALVSFRPYKEACMHEEACKVIEDGAGTHFNPVLVDVFHNAADEFKRIARENLEQAGFDKSIDLFVEDLLNTADEPDAE